MADLLDFSTLVNPLGPPEWLRAVISAGVSSLSNLADPDCTALVETVAEKHHVSPDEVAIGCGSTALLQSLPRALTVKRALIPIPSRLDFMSAAEEAGVEVTKQRLREDRAFTLQISELGERLNGEEAVFIGQPSDPTGSIFPPNELNSLALNHPFTTFIVDESFYDFTDRNDSEAEKPPPNVVIVRSLSYIYAIPGLRLGYAIADREIIRRLKNLMPSISLSSLAQAIGTAALRDTGYVEKSRRFVAEQREKLLRELQTVPGIKIYPGVANFLLCRLERAGMDAPLLGERMGEAGIAIRICNDCEGLDGSFFQVAVKSDEENRRLCRALKSEFGVPLPPIKRRKVPAVMFQGTSSNAGKSVLAAALCRILLQDGYRVAPFKAQNMSLNSYVTRDGGEMGRAQVVQAQACRLDPDVRMNPILLKPSSETGSQAIVMGKPVSTMNFEEYIQYKSKAFSFIKEAYDSLAAEKEVMVIEGAGSPAEVNLKDHDIANMKTARYAESPVLLVGDIEPGGVFASFIGTMEVMAEWERSLIAGFVINRFRGIKSLLDPALEYTQQHTGRPTLGVVPYILDLGLPEEDSVAFKNGNLDRTPPTGEHVEIAVIDLPHISNFTDFDAFRIEPDVYLKIIRTLQDFGDPDAVILPGSKNVIADLDYLRKTGLDVKITEIFRGGKKELIGICGGFQLIGERIADPHRIESEGRTVSGLGLLSISTVLSPDKTLMRASAKHIQSGLMIKGYEIHHGRTEGGGGVPTVLREDGEVIGVGSEDGHIWGTYLHGIFDDDAYRRWFIDRLRVKKGLQPIGRTLVNYDLEPALDRLADIVRQNLQVDEIYRLIGLK